MSSALAWVTALSVASSPVVPGAAEPASAETTVAGSEQRQPVTLQFGPPVVRRMGVRITVRRAGDDPIMHRPVDVHDLPAPATTDDAPTPARLELTPGSYILEAEVPGFLPSTRPVTVVAGTPTADVDWQMLPGSAHRTVSLAVVARGAAAPPTVSVTARHLAGDQAQVACASRRVPCELRLHKGDWEVEARAPGFLPLRRVVTVGDAEGQAIELALEPGLVDRTLPGAVGPEPGTQVEPWPPPRSAAEIRRIHVLGLSIASVPFFAAGLGMTAIGRLRYSQWLRSASCASYGSECADGIIPQIHVSAVGTGLVGAALGLLGVGLTGLKEPPRSVWFVELGVGGALTVAGGAWMAGNSVFLDRDLKTGPLAEIDARTSRRAVSSLILGLGLGLVAGSGAALLLRRGPRPATARVTPFGGLGVGGLALSGNF